MEMYVFCTRILPLSLPAHLLFTVMQQLQLKEKKFTVDTAAQPEAINDVWACLLSIDPGFTLQNTYKVSQKSFSPLLKDSPTAVVSDTTSLKSRSVVKNDCTMCAPVRLPKVVFVQDMHVHVRN